MIDVTTVSARLAGRLLRDPLTRFDRVVSILNPIGFAANTTSPPGFNDHPGPKLQLRFDDTETGPLAPTIEHARAIVSFLRDMYAGRLLVHCNGGKSRSTAISLWFLRYRRIANPLDVLERGAEHPPHLLNPNGLLLRLLHQAESAL